LSRISSKECREEINLSLHKVHELTGKPCELFAYPFGQLEDYNTDVIRTLETAGVRAAVTGISDINDGTTPSMELRRYGIGAGDSMAIFQMNVHHVMGQLLKIKQ
jgi:hypothetical protein